VQICGKRGKAIAWPGTILSYNKFVLSRSIVMLP
jgi:hypothetical protein